MDIPEVVKPRHVEIKLEELRKGTGEHREGTNLSRDFGMGWKGPGKNLALNTSRDRAATSRHLLKSGEHEKGIHVQRRWDI